VPASSRAGKVRVLSCEPTSGEGRSLAARCLCGAIDRTRPAARSARNVLTESKLRLMICVTLLKSTLFGTLFVRGDGGGFPLGMSVLAVQGSDPDVSSGRRLTANRPNSSGPAVGSLP
jgi:hypothetical protein